MKELSLNILDIAQNSVKAEAVHIDISVVDDGPVRTISVKDDGYGMSPAFLAAVADPFTTTRTTRPVGLGIPLLKLAAEQTGGSVTITSQQKKDGVLDYGTTITATFYRDHMDCPPLGDIASTMVTLIQGNPKLSITLTLKTVEGDKFLSTDDMRQMLGPEVPLDEPAVLKWAADYLNEKDAQQT